jgi:hypothetical protein
MDVLGDLIDRDRRSDAPALRAADSGRAYDYRRFCTSAWKTGNYLRHLGVRSGAHVAIADDPVPEPVLTLYGAAMLGGVVRFGPAREVDARALVVPTRAIGDYETPPGGQRVVYGARPEDPSVGYFERDVWSENPTEPPDLVSPEDDLLDAGGRAYTHGAMLDAAAGFAERWGLEPGHEVAVRRPFTAPGVVAAGLVAPVLAGATVLLPGEDGVGDYAVGEGPEAESVEPGEVL